MYYIALAVIFFVFIWRAVVGFKKGMVQELLSLVAMAVSGVCVVLILGALGNYLNHEIGKMVQIITVLLVVCFVYRLISILFTSLKLVSKLPIVKSVDKLLGIVVGLVEAGLIVALLVQLLKSWGILLLS